ncbi:MAG: hypothetical protein M3680_30305 [Myxococcota bacterium]|nr:hypothetical protein [Myxococcota bacterium]
MRFKAPLVLACAASLTSAACSDPADPGDEGELITTVTLTFTPPAGAPIVASFDDPDGDGGAPPTIDPITLVAGTTYATTVRFLNSLETPPEDITIEVADEADEHQVFFTGTAVAGPASNQPGAPLTHAYADRDANDLPIGLASTVTATAAGTGTLTVTLRHLPPLGGAPTKTSELAAQVQAGGFAAIAGGTDAQVNFAVTVP